MNIEVIEWWDAVAAAEWTQVPQDIHLCTTVGRVVFEDDKRIVLAPTWSEDWFNNQMAIPKGWIHSRKTYDISSALSAPASS